jgi:hypothetical protein
LNPALPCPSEHIFTNSDVEIIAKVGDLLAADEHTTPLVLPRATSTGSMGCPTVGRASSRV